MLNKGYNEQIIRVELQEKQIYIKLGIIRLTKFSNVKSD